MPRGYNDYSFVIDSSFQPFSMQEMLVPFAMYKNEFEKQEAMLDELSKNTDTFKYLEQVAKDNPESKAAQIYNTYASDLRKYGDDFSANGLSMANSRGLRNMKRRYQGEIGRLAKIDEIRRAQIKEQNELRLNDPTRLFSRRADLTDLDKYLENPDLGYESYSGALLAQQVGTAASAIAKGLRDYGNGKPLDGFTKTWLQQHGYTAAEVAQAIQNPALDKTGVLNSIVEQAVQSSGLPQWADAATLNQAYQYARQGLWSAVGQTSVSAYTDEAAKLAAQEASQKRVAGLVNSTMNITPKFDRRNVRTTAEMAAIAKDVEMLNKYGKYFVQNPKTGHYSLTQEGMKKYKETPYIYRGPYSSGIDNDADSEFKGWLDSRGLSEMAQGRTGNYQSSILQGIMARAANKYDTNTAGEYTGLIDSSQYDNVLGVLNKAAQEGILKNYERKKKGNSYEFVPTDDVDVSDLTNSDIKSAVPVFGKHGNFLEVTLKGGDRIIVPYNNLNTNYNTMVTGNVNDALMLEQEIAEAKAQGKVAYHRYSDGRIVPSTVALTDVLNQGYDNFMSGLGTSQVEPQKTTRGLYQMR